jgi:monofunctional biosynthetic peptidoglycan transglycosylase
MTAVMKRRSIWFPLFMILGLIAVAGALYAWLTWPDVAVLATRNPSTTAFIERYRREQRVVGRPDRVAWRWVPDDSISPNLKRAIITSEDIGFFSHHGFELAEIRQALTKAVREGTAPRGASTITQQLAKNLWLSPSRNPLRKVTEAILTRQLEAHLSKRRILELYVNTVEFGPGVYGAEAAAEYYFGKSAVALSDHEAALLAASLPRPRTWNPNSASKAYARQVARVEDRMARATFLRKRLGEPIEAEAGTPVLDSALMEFLQSDTFFRGDTAAPDTASGGTR